MSKYSVRNIMLGIGIGLVISSIITINASQQHISLDELQREAEHYNFKLVKNEIEKSYTDIEPTEIPQVEESETNEVPSGEIQQKEIITFKIESGANSYTVADDLIAAGIIEDRKGFLDRLFQLEKDEMLQVGTFYIEENADFDTIIKILTTVQ